MGHFSHSVEITLIRMQPETMSSPTGLVALFSMADIVLAKPWMVSTTVQRQVFQIARRHAADFRKGDGRPRYCMWVPVFDGSWDFEEMIRVATGKSLHGTLLLSKRAHFAVSKSVAKQWVP